VSPLLACSRGRAGLTNTGLTNPGLTNAGLANAGLTNTGLTNAGLTNPGPANSAIDRRARWLRRHQFLPVGVGVGRGVAEGWVPVAGAVTCPVASNWAAV